MSDEIEILRTETKDLHDKVQEATVKSQEAWNQSAKFEHTIESLKLSREKEEWLQKNINDLRHDLKERNEPDEWLQAEVEQYEQRMTLHEKEMQQNATKYDSLRHKIDQARGTLRIKHIEAGKYEEQKANHEQQLENRKALIRQTAWKHNIRGYETDLDDQQIKGYLDKLVGLHKEQIVIVERVRQEVEKEMEKSRDILSKLGERKSALLESKANAKQQLVSNDQRIGSCSAELNRIEVDVGAKALQEATIRDLDARLTSSRVEFKTALWDRKIHEENVNLRSTDDEIDQLNRDLVQVTKYAGDVAKLDHLKNEMKNSQRSLDTMIEAHSERLSSILGQGWRLLNLDAELQQAISDETQHLKDAQHQRDEIVRSLEGVQYEIKSTRANLNNCEHEVNRFNQEIRSKINGEPYNYNEILNKLQQRRNDLKADVGDGTYDKNLCTKSITAAKERQRCYLCRRPWDNNEGREIFIQLMEKQIAKSVTDYLEDELKAAEIALEEAKSAGPTHDSWLRLSKSELPRLRNELGELEVKRENFLHQIETHDQIVNEKEQAKVNVEMLLKPVASITKHNQDTINYKHLVEEQSIRIEQMSSSYSAEEIRDQLMVTGGKSRRIREEVSKLIAEKERARSNLSALELDLSRAKNDLAATNHQLEKKGNVSKQIEELRNGNQELRNSIRLLDEQINELAPQITKEEIVLEDARQRSFKKGKELQQGVDRVSDSIYQLKLADQNIQAYLNGRSSESLDECLNEIEKTQQEVARYEGQQKQITIEINKTSEQLRHHQEDKRSILENIKYRRSLKELEAVKAEITELGAQNAEADLEQYQRRATYWEQQHKLHLTAETSKLGTMKAKDDQLMQLLDDWNTDYKDAAYKYKESHVKVEVISLDRIIWSTMY